MIMSCPWIESRAEKDEEKTLKYGPMMSELKQRYSGYRVEQNNVLIDELGGFSKHLEKSVRKLLRARSKKSKKNYDYTQPLLSAIFLFSLPLHLSIFVFNLHRSTMLSFTSWYENNIPHYPVLILPTEEHFYSIRRCGFPNIASAPI